jgi:hypothetical protein
MSFYFCVCFFPRTLLNENFDLQVDDKGKINLSGLLKLTAGYGENGMFLLSMMLHICIH